MQKLLFLCTGNYYRSRFAEEYFNYYAVKRNLPWRADSMGIQRDFTGNGNVGPISTITLAELASIGIEAQGKRRMPKHVYERDFGAFDKIIAMSREEHEPMLSEIWNMANKNIDYFNVEDLHIEDSDSALPRLRKHLDNLLEKLSKH